MAGFKKFENIEVWQKARALDLELFRLVEETRIAKDFKLRDQMLGSSGSIMDNIAEGFGRDGNREFIQFLYISKGSCVELMSQSYRAFDRNYITESDLETLLKKLHEINNKTQALISCLANSDFKGPKYNTKQTAEQLNIKQQNTKQSNTEYGTI